MGRGNIRSLRCYARKTFWIRLDKAVFHFIVKFEQSLVKDCGTKGLEFIFSFLSLYHSIARTCIHNVFLYYKILSSSIKLQQAVLVFMVMFGKYFQKPDEYVSLHHFCTIYKLNK